MELRFQTSRRIHEVPANPVAHKLHMHYPQVYNHEFGDKLSTSFFICTFRLPWCYPKRPSMWSGGRLQRGHTEQMVRFPFPCIRYMHTPSHVLISPPSVLGRLQRSCWCCVLTAPQLRHAPFSLNMRSPLRSTGLLPLLGGACLARFRNLMVGLETIVGCCGFVAVLHRRIKVGRSALSVKV